MKKNLPSLVLASAALAGAALSLGCASVGASSTEPLLSAAGFVIRTPANPREQQLYDALPSYQLQHGNVKGNVLYAYKDEKKGVAYVGSEAAYQRYQQLAVQQRIANDYYQAAEMNREASVGWYGAYGPYVGARPIVIRR